MKTIKTKWTGIRPLLMNNGQMCDPTNPASRRVKELTRKGSKKLTDSDYDEIYQRQWAGKLYWSEELGAVVPAANLERCIQLGAQKSRLGKDVQAAVFCVGEEIKLDYAGPRTAEQLYASGKFQLKVPVVINKARVISIRPMFPTKWSLTFELEFDETILNEKNLIKAMQDAGALVGLGDWRPKFGRFSVEII